MADRKQIHLWGFLQGVGYYPGGWRHQAASPRGVFDLEFYVRIGKMLEQAGFDAVVFGDQLEMRSMAGKTPGYLAAPTLDPLTLLSVIASVTSRLGLVGTVSTTFHEPYALATMLATLDRLSAGRTGWNIVTTSHPNAPWNFGQPALLDKSVRYARAEEFVDVALKFWTGETVRHTGRHFSVEGQLPAPPPPQGHPVLVQAGQSEDGREFAARVAEAIFCPARTLEDGRAYCQDIRARMAKYGRDPASVAIMPGLSFLLASTEAEAADKHRAMLELADAGVAIDYLSESIGFDLSPYPSDGPIPLDDVLAGCEFPPDDVRLRLAPGVKEGLSIRQTAERYAQVPRGHQTFRGTPEQLADHMEHWLDAGACDGFTLQPAYLPGELEIFVDQVVPLLQRRGTLRTDYGGRTLRSHLNGARS